MHAPAPLSYRCDHPVRWTLFHNEWDNLAMLHWPVDPSAVAEKLPPGLRVDTWDDRAWVSLVPFVMRDVRPAGLPSMPWLSTFCETNVRTYVVDAEGHRSVWFHSLDAARLPIVGAARRLMGFPYVWSRMRCEIHGTCTSYETTRRRWPRASATSRVTVDQGDPVDAASGLDLFLTARWSTVTYRRGRVVRAPVDHAPWHLRDARVLECSDELVAAAGYTVDSEPIARIAAPLHARFGRFSVVP